MKIKTLCLNPMALAITLAFTASAHAVGTGEIISGTGSINKNQNNTVVNQNTDKMVINWDNMSIAEKESMQFIQPGKNSAVLNRVSSLDPTLIQGALNANGQVFIVNPNGVLIGKGASINVGSLIASSLDIKDSDFMKGNLNFAGNGEGTVSNEGTIKAGDSIVLMGAGEVSNKGIIHAANGNASVAAGEHITLSFPSMGKINVKITKGSLRALVNNGGIIKTPNGSVALTAWATDALTRSVINNTGTLEADQIVMRADGIYLEGQGDIDIAGNVSARSVYANGNNINIKDNAVVKSDVVTTLVANKKDGYVKFEKSTINGPNLQIDADNVLTGGEGNGPTLVNAGLVSIHSGSNDLNIGEKGVTRHEQLSAGKSVISENLVNSVSKSKAFLSVNSKAENIDLDNASLDYGHMAVVSQSKSGSVNLKSSAKGNSLRIYSSNKFEQSKDAEVNMSDAFTLSSRADIHLTNNIKAGNKITIETISGDITQAGESKISANHVNYKGRNVHVDGSILSGDLTLSAENFTQGEHSSLHAMSALMTEGDFDLTSGDNKFDALTLSVGNFDLNTAFDTQIVEGSFARGKLNINSAGDVKLGGLSVGDAIGVNANNISTASNYYHSSLYSGKNLVLNAKNNISLSNIDSGENLSINGKNINAGYVSSMGDTAVNASGNIEMAGINAQGDLKLTSGDKINIAESLAGNGVNIAANGTVTLSDINAQRGISITSEKDVYLKSNVYADGNIDISGNNIFNAGPDAWYKNIINSAGEVMLKAKNSIKAGMINAFGQDYWTLPNSGITLSATDISADQVTTNGDIKISAKNNINIDNMIDGKNVEMNAGGKTRVNGITSKNDITIATGGDFIFSNSLSADEHISIHANNIQAYSDYWSPVDINSGRSIKLVAKNDINVGNISTSIYHWYHYADNIYLNGKSITAENVSAAGDISIIAENSIRLRSAEARNINLTANQNIKINDVNGNDSVNATSKMGRITFDTLHMTSNKNLSAKNGVSINYDENDYMKQYYWWL